MKVPTTLPDSRRRVNFERGRVTDKLHTHCPAQVRGGRRGRELRDAIRGVQGRGAARGERQEVGLLLDKASLHPPFASLPLLPQGLQAWEQPGIQAMQPVVLGKEPSLKSTFKRVGEMQGTAL